MAAVSDATRDQALAAAGYGLKSSVLAALHDSRPELRSLAALKLASERRRAGLTPLLQAWLVENDRCSRAVFREALQDLLQVLAEDPAQHPAGQYWVTPFQPCAPSPHPLLALNIESVPRVPATTLQVTIRNLTRDPVAFLKPHNPAEFFSVSVFGPNGQRSPLSPNAQRVYASTSAASPSNQTLFVHGPAFVALQPGESASWYWSVAENFDMTQPGVYRVSFGGRIPYLDTTVCSNTAELTVK